MSRQFAQRLGHQGGYSLIELLVGVAIFGLLAAIGLPHLDTRRQDIQTTTKQVIADYRWARTRAITSGDHFAVEWVTSGRYEIQRMKQQVNGSWAVDAVVKEVTLPANISTVWYWPQTHEFNTRGMMISSNYALWQLLWDDKYYGWHMISVWPSGQVYEEY
jgi:prepilin-type N-terminal cleavage/methylation domain-containing protein